MSTADGFGGLVAMVATLRILTPPALVTVPEWSTLDWFTFGFLLVAVGRLVYLSTKGPPP